MKNITRVLCLLLFTLFSIHLSYSQSTIYTEDFEGSDLSGYAVGNGDTNTDYGTQVLGGTSSDYIKRGLVGSFNFAGTLTGNATNFIGVEDVNGAGLSFNGHSYIELDAISIASTTGMTIDIDVAFPNTTATRYETTKYLIVDYSIDGGSYSTALAFYGDATSAGMRQDTNLDGVGNGTLVNTAMTTFTADLDAIAGSPVTGSNIEIRVRFNSPDSQEEIAFDNIVLKGTVAASCSAPTAAATSAMFGSETSSALNLTSFTAPVGGADGYAIYINDTNTFSNPSDGDEPVADLTWNGAGQQAVYFGTSSSPNITVSDLDPGTTYYFQIYAYNDCSGTETYETTGLNTNDTTALGVLTITGLTGDDKEYDDTTAATATGTAVLNGVAAGANDVSLSGSPVFTFASANVGTGITVNTTGYTLSGTDAGKYTLTQPTLSADITAKELTITGLTGDNKVYDGTTAATASGTATLVGVESGDDVSLGGSPVFTFASANVGTGITMNTSGYTISGTDSGNYTLTQPTLSADITAAELTIVGLTGDNKVYDGTTAATASGTATISGIIGADDVILGGSPVFTFASANVGTGITMNTSGYTLSGTDSGNYLLTQPTLSADITAAELTIVGLTGDNKVYDGTTAATASGTATLSGIIGADDVILGGSPVFVFASANVGTGITMNTSGYTTSGTDSGNYLLTQPTLSADITAAELTVVGLTGDDKAFDGTTAATASGTATLSGIIGADDVILGGSPVFTFASSAVGTGITINTTGYTISGTDSGNYTLTQPTLSADITGLTLTITGLTGDNKVYDGTTAATASGTATLDGVVGGDDVSLGGSPVFTFASANVGTGITMNTSGYTLTGADAGKYSLTQPTLSADITAAELTIVGLTGDNKVYDGTTAATATGTATLSGIIGADDVILGGSPVFTFASANVGTGITMNTSGYTTSGTDSGNYLLTQPTLSADITAAELTIVGLTGDNKVYDGTTAATATGTATISGIIGADDVILGGSPVFTFASANVGTGITMNTSGYTTSGTDSGNYLLTQPTLSADITAAELTIVGLTGDNKVYDGTTAATATGTATLSGIIGADDVILGGSPVFTFASANVGTGITMNTSGYTTSGTDSGNYLLTQPTLSADITAKELTITGLTGDNKVYDGTTAATASGTATLVGVESGDDVSLGGSPVFTFASANVGTGITVFTTGYTISGTDSGNYTLTQPTLSADITAAELTIVGLTGDDKGYDGTTAATASGTATLSGIIGADDVILGGSSVFTFASANVGTGIVINTTGYTISGTNSANYTVTQPILSGDITAAELTIVGLTGDNKVYDGTTAATATGTATLSGIFGADDVILGGSPVFTFASANVGTGITMNTSGYTISGTDSGNYTLTQPTLSADITAAELTIVGLTGDDKVYDGTTAATASGTATLSGIFGADDVNLGGSPVFTFASANPGTGITITTTGYTISGTDSGNYTLTQPTLSADITGQPVQFTSTSSSGVESTSPVTIPVDLSIAHASLTATVDYAVTGGTATGSGTDFTLASGTLTFSPGSTTENISVAITDDMTVETNETIVITLSNPTNATLGTNTSFTYTINDDDTTTVTIEDITVNEADGTATLTATLSNAIAEPFFMNITTADVTTSGASDYTEFADAPAIDFAGTAGETQPVSIPITNDMIGEDVETFTVTFTSVSGTSLGASIVTGDAATVTINDDDAPQVTALTPMDDAVDVAISTNLTITFNQNVVAGTGNILIRDRRDDSTIESIDVTGSAVSIASNVVTIDPTSDLPSETDIYVEVPAGAFENSGGQGNDAILGDAAWNFTTEDITAPTVVVSTTTASPTNSTFTATFTFSEPITNFDLTDITVTNGTASVFNQISPTVYEALITPTADGEVTVSILAGALQDDSSNANDNEASNVLSLIYDITNPTLDITTAETDPTNASPFAVTFTFSEDMDSFEADDLTLTNATIGNFAQVSASVFTADITPIADGLVTIDLEFDSVEDLAGNPNEAATFSITYDGTPPTVVISSMVADPTNAAFDVTITFSEDVVDLVLNDIQFTNGIPSDLVFADSEATLTITPVADGPVTVFLPANATEDFAGNGNVASNIFEVLYDATRPTVTIATDAPDPTNAGFTATITFSEAVTGFEMADIVFDNATPSAFNPVSTTEYTVFVTPIDDGTVSIDVPENVAEDAATNGNEASDQYSVEYDFTRPTVDIQSSAADPINGPFVVTITFDEDVTGFTMSDLVVTNGVPSDFIQISGSVYEVTITPTADGAVTVEVPENVAEDAATNGNEASDLFEITFDGTRPVPTIGSSVADPTNAPFDITITFTEDVFGFTDADINVTNGSVTAFSGMGALYTATITPAADGTVDIFIPEAVTEDLATNPNEASGTFSVLYDATNPTPTISTVAAEPVNAPFVVDIIFDENVFGFTEADLVVTNGTTSDFTPTSDSVYSVLISPTGAGDVIVEVPAAVAEDLATNPNNGASFTIEYDNIPPLPPNITHISEYTCAGDVMQTGDNTLEIFGTAERESTVEVFIDGISIGTVVTDEDSGFWSFDYTGTTLADGTYSFTAIATDIAMNTGDLSAPFTITVNTVDSDGDGNPDFCDEDDDGNGATDTEEDCDGDGIVDSQDTDNSSCRQPIQQRRTYGFSPNGDGVNEAWVIENITSFPNNVVQVFNRSGKLVFKQNNYQNDWEAESNQLNGNTLGRRLPVGPYIYVIDLGDGSAPIRGWLYINY
jgi:gliding motility-associated-like protein